MVDGKVCFGVYYIITISASLFWLDSIFLLVFGVVYIYIYIQNEQIIINNSRT